MSFGIFSHDSTCCDNASFGYSDSRKNHGSSPNPATIFNCNWLSIWLSASATCVANFVSAGDDTGARAKLYMRSDFHTSACINENLPI